MKTHIKALYALLSLQFLYRTILFILTPAEAIGFTRKIAGYPGFLMLKYMHHHSDIFITVPIVVLLIYSIWKLLLGLSYQKQTTSGTETILLSSVFLYEFICLAEGSLSIYLAFRKA
jgi:hypothetical protein